LNAADAEKAAEGDPKKAGDEVAIFHSQEPFTAENAESAEKKSIFKKRRTDL
jgi:hypothetical protein